MKQTTTVMSTYEIEVRETRVEVVPVVAESAQAARERVVAAYFKDEVDLDHVDRKSVEIKQV